MRRMLLVISCLSLLAIPAELLAQGQGQKKDPFTTFLFGLKIDGLPGDLGAGTAFFKSVAGLSSETEVVEFQEGGSNLPPLKIAGKLRYANITLKRAVTADKSLATWRKTVEDGQYQQARKNGSITLFDQANREVARWAIVNAWPSKISIEIDENSGEPVEVIVLAVDASHRQ